MWMYVNTHLNSHTHTHTHTLIRSFVVDSCVFMSVFLSDADWSGRVETFLPERIKPQSSTHSQGLTASLSLCCVSMSLTPSLPPSLFSNRCVVVVVTPSPPSPLLSGLYISEDGSLGVSDWQREWTPAFCFSVDVRLRGPPWPLRWPRRRDPHLPPLREAAD